MSEIIDEGLMYLEESLESTIHHLQYELTKIRTGKASPSILEGIMVDYYGAETPINQVANLGTSDAKTITIQPWEKKMLGVIEQAIFAANLGLTPMNDGEMIRISIPPLTEDRRKSLVKQAKAHGEDAKVSIRSARHKMMDAIKKAVKDGFPEDAGKSQEDDVEQDIKSYYHKVDELISAKEKDIMKV